MALEALAICGIRGYDPNILHKITFLQPITLIHGKNGSGKTTIIQCLKYITTGSLPPSTDRGKSFIMDPMIAGTAQVKGDVRLRFKTTKNRQVIAKKILLLSKTNKGLTFKSVQQSLRTKDEEGKEIEVNQRCADIDKQIPQMLGMSKCILQNIVFCHQDDSLWPFSDNSTLKGIFDELFDTRRFTKTMENMKQAVKVYEKEKLELKGQLEYLKMAYKKTTENRTQALQGWIHIAETSEELFQVKEQLKPIRQKLRSLESEQKQKNTLYQEKGALQSNLASNQQILNRLKLEAEAKNIVIVSPQQHENLDQVLDKIRLQIESKEKMLKSFQLLLQDTRTKEAAHQKKIELHAEIKRAQQILPELRSTKIASQIVEEISKIHELKKKKWRSLEQLKYEYEKIVIPRIHEYDHSEDQLMQKNLNSKKEKAQNLLKRIQNEFNCLYSFKCQESKADVMSADRYAGEKLRALQAQIDMKKKELKKYQEMDPNQKSAEQEIFEIRYAGIQLQAQFLNFMERRKQCLLCLRNLNDGQYLAVRKKIQKTIQKTSERIQQLEERKGQSNKGIDPTPIIKEIEAFLHQGEKLQRKLSQQNEKFKIHQKNMCQLKVNEQIKSILATFPHQLAFSKHIKGSSLGMNEFRELVSEYKILFSEIRNNELQMERSRKIKAKYEQDNKKSMELSVRKNQILKKLKEDEKDVSDIQIVGNIAEKLSEMYAWIRKEEEKLNSSDESSYGDFQNKIYQTENELVELRKDKIQIQLSIENAKYELKLKQYQLKYNELMKKLQSFEAHQSSMNQLEKEKNQLQLIEAKLKEKIKLKKDIHSRYVEEDPTYLEKLVRFHALGGLISDVQNSIKAMERATNRVHNEKMDEINKILYDIWQDVYHEKDIEFIRINSVAEKKNSGYGYSIMMKKNEQLIQMKGRCSMGQKVLASLIIRMALAEAFSSSTHILALDEPTTNLDRGHIENLARSIGVIIEQNSRLQLIIISHDLQFVSQLNRYTNYYYEISRNAKNFSQIQKKEIIYLQEEKQVKLENMY